MVFSDDADKFGRVMTGLKCDAEKIIISVIVDICR